VYLRCGTGVEAAAAAKSNAHHPTRLLISANMALAVEANDECVRPGTSRDCP
jgi:deoxyribodipyrimidine photolyase-like uncharacterized protein